MRKWLGGWLAIGLLWLSPARTATVRPPRPETPDRKAPEVAIRILEGAQRGYLVEINAQDTDGVALVQIAVDGRVVETRLHAPWYFLIGDGNGSERTPATPFEVCAQAEDRKGRWSPPVCTVVTGPDGCLTNDDCGPLRYCHRPASLCQGPGSCLDRPCLICCIDSPPPCCPVPEAWLACGCDGHLYLDACEAAQKGVDVAHPGRCP